MGLMMLGRQIHTAEPLVPEPSPSDPKIAIEKLKSCKHLGTDKFWQN
jgi:hypothetical protein